MNERTDNLGQERNDEVVDLDPAVVVRVLDMRKDASTQCTVSHL